MKKLFGIILVGLLVANTGCVSMWTHGQWKEAQAKKAVRVEADGETVMVGVDVTALDYVKENPGLATIAALADVGIAYGAYTLGQDLFNGNGGNDSNEEQNNSVNVSGNQNSSVNITISGNQDNDPTTNNDTSNNNYQ